MAQPILEVRNITCERSERTLFKSMSFGIEPGTLVRIAGSNGAGKTTLLRLLTGLMRPLEGEILWRGTPLREAAHDFWRELCYIGHRNGVKDDLTALENLRINCRIASLEAREEDMIRALVEVGLGDFIDVPVGQLSQGQRRRVALARLWLSGSSVIWMLDEPFTALDVKAVARLAEIIAEHVRSGGVVIYVTHQEVDVGDVNRLEIRPEDFAPRRRTAQERALDDLTAEEAAKAE